MQRLLRPLPSGGKRMRRLSPIEVALLAVIAGAAAFLAVVTASEWIGALLDALASAGGA